MSLKAFRVIHIHHSKAPSFNLMYDDKLVEFLSDKYEFFVLVEDNGVGLVTLPIEALQQALEEVTMTEDVKAAIKTDIETNKATGWIQYLVTYED